MATVLINGINYSWANISVLPLGIPLNGITKISYKAKQEKTNNHGAGSKPVSRGYGREEYEASIEVYTDEWKRFIAASPEKNPLKIPPFDIPVVFAGDGVLPTTDILLMAEFLEDPLEANEGDTKLLVTIPLIIAGIEH